MASNQLNRSLLQIILLGWAAFAIASLAIRTVFAVPDIVLLVDRSYCDPARWRAVSDEYATIYQQDQRGQLNLESVILFSDLGEETTEPLSPDEFRDLKTYGPSSSDRQAALEAAHPNARLLQCEP